ncbi:glycosyltransferase family 8 [Lecanosticta acicola]|uniref:Glycosyltransferase family 8 n=1 Tax=Lecanosticta acicola TaxID=111012 RepID=A0AAI8Z4N7_9PEZI|nr:glycosyltransferase family 8 [Lecanosticta acicola]
MRRILLSQSQVSIVVSSGVVFLFTVLLFLSGYIIQQRTVKGLQSALKPRIPQAPTSFNTHSQPSNQDTRRSSRIFGQQGGHVAYADLDRDVHDAGASVNWQRLAHIQLVRNHHDVCSAIMIMAELHNQKSPARRLLLFPKAWAEEKEASKGDISDPYLASTRRLMRMAARRYHVELHPIDPIRKDGDVEKYSLASAFALQGSFDRVLTIETPGLLLDSEPLDALLGFTEPAPFMMLHDTVENDGVHSEDLFLFEPSKDIYLELKERIAEPKKSGYNDTDLASFFTDPVLLASSNENNALIRSIGTLHDVGRNFNQTAFLSDVGYIRFSDPKLPGPEYEVPWADKVSARPRNKDADWTWTKLYGEFAEKRMDICGLDLESWRPWYD